MTANDHNYLQRPRFWDPEWVWADPCVCDMLCVCSYQGADNCFPVVVQAFDVQSCRNQDRSRVYKDYNKPSTSAALTLGSSRYVVGCLICVATCTCDFARDGTQLLYLPGCAFRSLSFYMSFVLCVI